MNYIFLKPKKLYSASKTSGRVYPEICSWNVLNPIRILETKLTEG